MYMVCYKRIRVYEDCQVGVGPLHAYDTRDETLRTEYANELDRIVIEAKKEVFDSMKPRKDL
jgi:hypothetical protein